MTKITTATLAVPALLLALACGKAPADSSRVLANVGGEKITEAEFQELMASLVPKDQLKEFMDSPDPRVQAQRVQLLGELAHMRALTQFARTQGLDQDPKVRFMLQGAQAQVFRNALMERNLGQPTEAQLRAKYDEMAAASKAAGQDKGFPSFDEVNKTPQLHGVLVQKWQQGQAAQAQKGLEAQVKAAVPMTYAEGYQPVE